MTKIPTVAIWAADAQISTTDSGASSSFVVVTGLIVATAKNECGLAARMMRISEPPHYPRAQAQRAVAGQVPAGASGPDVALPNPGCA
jgi:hypothetical protein